MELMATLRKEKLPRGFSYPVGAEALSQGLVGVPQFSLTRLLFSWRDEFWASRYNAKLEAAGAIVVIEANFFTDWLLNVHAVPRVHARDVRELVSSRALPALRTKLMGTPVEPRYFSWKASYDLGLRTIAVGGSP